MAINRYNRPAGQPLINTYDPLPYKELMQGLAAKEQMQDQRVAGALDLGDREFQYLNMGIDPERAEYYRNELDTKASQLARTDLTTPEGKRALREFERWGKKAFGQEGEIGALQASYDARQAIIKEHKEATLKGDKNRAFQAKAALAAFDANYEKSGGIGPGGMEGYNVYQGESLEKYVDLSKWAMDNAGKIASSTNAYAEVAPDGRGYIFKRKGTNEVIEREEIYNTLLGPNWQEVVAGNAPIGGLAGGSGEVKAYLGQGTRLGYADFDELLDAVYGSGEAASFRKETRDKSLTSDPVQAKALERQIEADKALASMYLGTSSMVTEDGDEIPMSHKQDMVAYNDNLAKQESLQTNINNAIAGYPQYINEDGSLSIDLADPAQASKLSPGTLAALQNYQANKAELGTVELDLSNQINREIDIFRESVGDQPGFDKYLNQVNNILNTHEEYKNKSEYEKSLTRKAALNRDHSNLISHLNELSGGNLYDDIGQLPIAQQRQDFDFAVKGYGDAYYEKQNKNARTYQTMALNEDTKEFFNLGMIEDDIKNNPQNYESVTLKDGKRYDLAEIIKEYPETTMTQLINRGQGEFIIIPMKEVDVNNVVYDPQTGEAVLADSGDKVETRAGKYLIKAEPVRISSKNMNISEFMYNNLKVKAGSGIELNEANKMMARFGQRDLTQTLEREFDANGISDGKYSTGVIKIGNPQNPTYIKAIQSSGNPDKVVLYETDSKGNNAQPFTADLPMGIEDAKNTILLQSMDLRYQ